MNTVTQTQTTYTWAEIQDKLGLAEVTPKPAKVNQPRAVSRAPANIPELLQQQCKDGERTQHLTRLAGALLAKGLSLEDITAMCLMWNANNIEPLEEDKIEHTCASIQKSDQRNHPERYQSAQVAAPLFDLSAGRIDRYIQTDPPPRRWLLDELLVLGKVGAIVAPGGSSKSQWLLQLAVGVATGLPVAEYWKIGEKGQVLMLCAEDDHDEIHRRIKRIVNHLALAGHVNELQGIEDRLYVFSTIGYDTLLTKRGSTGEVSATHVVDHILALSEQLSDLKLIIVDPASRFRGGEENSNEDATRFVEALETIAKKTGASTLIAHHTNKVSYGADAEPGQGASRGASALTDGLRWQMNMGRLSDRQLTEVGASKDQSGRYVAATVTKTNYSAFPAPVLLERMDDGYLTAISAQSAKQRKEMIAILAIVRTVASQPHQITARQLEDRFGGVGSVLKTPKQDLRELIKIAIARGFLTGGDRKKLQVTQQGRELCMPDSTGTAAENARHAPETPPRMKI